MFNLQEKPSTGLLTSDPAGCELPLVLFYLDSHTYGGAEYYVATLLARGGSERFRVRLALTHWPNMEQLLAELARRGVQYDIIDSGSVTSAWQQFWRSFEYFRRTKPHIVHFNRTWNYGFTFPQLAARLAGVRRLVMTENLQEVLNKKSARHFGGLLRGFGLWRGRRILERRLSVANIDLIVSPTDASRKTLLNDYRYPPSKAVVIPYGVEFDAASEGISRKHTRSEIGFSDSDLLIGTVGRLCYQKGFRYLLSAFKMLLARFPSARLCIVGEGELRGELETFIRQHDLSRFVRVLGHRTDVADLLRCFDVFVFPSLFESAGIALLEAMSYGLPVVASDLQEFQGVVEPDTTGLLVPPGDIDALANALYTLVTNSELRTFLGERAKSHVHRLFSASKCVDRTYALYARLLSEGCADRSD